MSLFSVMSIGASGMAAQRTRAEMLVENLANAETTRTPGGGPPGRGRQGRDADMHPDRAAYRDGRERTRPRSSPHAATQSWPLAGDSRRTYAPGMLTTASDQTLFSLPPRADLTPSSVPTHGCSFHGSR